MSANGLCCVDKRIWWNHKSTDIFAHPGEAAGRRFTPSELRLAFSVEESQEMESRGAASLQPAAGGKHTQQTVTAMVAVRTGRNWWNVILRDQAVAAGQSPAGRSASVHLPGSTTGNSTMVSLSLLLPIRPSQANNFCLSHTLCVTVHYALKILAVICNAFHK